jgi:hypothetical protein
MQAAFYKIGCKRDKQKKMPDSIQPAFFNLSKCKAERAWRNKCDKESRNKKRIPIKTLD